MDLIVYHYFSRKILLYKKSDVNLMETIAEIEQYFKTRRSLGIKPGLERMNLLLEKLEYPEKNVRAIHLAGTNGKGSTVQLIANSLIANHYKVGIFSSPSFMGLPGHFLIDNEPICKRDLIELVNKIVPLVEELDKCGEAPTEFEILTALAFLYFENRVDLVLIEAGMGGRFDTTNCVRPILSVITSVSRDHEQFLGNTIAEIAYHKAGIIKKNRPVIIGPVTKDVSALIKKEAQAQAAPTLAYGEQFVVTKEGEKVIWQGPDGREILIKLQLEGQHQIENAALALMVLSYLADKWQYKIDWKKVIDAMSKVSLPGRFEMLTTAPTIIIDSAHNIAGVEAFIETAMQRTNGKASRLLFASFRDKNIEEMLKKLIEANFTVTLTTFDHERATKRADFLHILKDVSPTFQESWQEEIRKFLSDTSPAATLFITGSLHFVSLVRQFVKQEVESDKSRS